MTPAPRAVVYVPDDAQASQRQRDCIRACERAGIEIVFWARGDVKGLDNAVQLIEHGEADTLVIADGRSLGPHRKSVEHRLEAASARLRYASTELRRSRKLISVVAPGPLLAGWGWIEGHRRQLVYGAVIAISAFALWASVPEIDQEPDYIAPGPYRPPVSPSPEPTPPSSPSPPERPGPQAPSATPAGPRPAPSPQRPDKEPSPTPSPAPEEPTETEPTKLPPSPPKLPDDDDDDDDELDHEGAHCLHLPPDETLINPGGCPERVPAWLDENTPLYKRFSAGHSRQHHGGRVFVANGWQL